MISHLRTIIKNLKSKKQGIGAFNTFNLETTQAIIKAAAELKIPLIIQLTPKSIDYTGLLTAFNLIKTIDQELKSLVKIAIHLDHGKDWGLIKKCIDLGFSSVHFDGANLPFNKNIQLTKKVVQYAHQKNVWVQGEVGAILGKEGLIKLKNKKDQLKFLTDPLKAKEFIKKTNIDTLAISVGTLHGLFKGKENLDFPRIIKIKKLCEQTPLVLHGASGVTANQLKMAIKSGITIFNIDTSLRIVFTQATNKTLKQQTNLIDPRIYLKAASLAVKNQVKNYLKIFKTT